MLGLSVMRECIYINICMNVAVKILIHFVLTHSPEIMYCSLQTREVRKMKHFLFLSWPDYGVPPDANGFLKFLFHVRKAQHEFTKDMEWKVC